MVPHPRRAGGAQSNCVGAGELARGGAEAADYTSLSSMGATAEDLADSAEL